MSNEPWFAVIVPATGGASWPEHGLLHGPRRVNIDRGVAYHPDDAMLMADAPRLKAVNAELLAVCEAAGEYLTDMHSVLARDEVAAQLRSAIAKAKGEGTR